MKSTNVRVVIGSVALTIGAVSTTMMLGGVTAACATSPDTATDTRPDASGPSSLGDSGANASGFGEAGTADGSSDGCAETTKLVYTLDADKMLRRFDPTTFQFTTIGELDCPTEAGTNSMAVDRNGTAWVLYDDGTLFKVSTKDASCETTSFVPFQAGISTFGMGFATNGDGSASETLYVAGYPPATKLAKLSLDTMKLTVVGTLDHPTRAELSGTGSGQLFAFFDAKDANDEEQIPSIPFMVAELEKGSGKFVSTAPQAKIPPISVNFAFAAWGGDFYLFAFSSVYRYRPTTKETTKVATPPFLVVGAGVSTCAPHVVVK